MHVCFFVVPRSSFDSILLLISFFLNCIRVDTLVPADAFSDLFEYLLHCIVNRDLKRTQRSAATRVFDSPRAVALWNKVSEKADTMLAMDFMTDSLRNSIKKNSVGLTSAEFDPAGQLFHAVAFGLPCPPERWAGGAQSDDIYDRVRVYGENIWVESSAPPCTMNQVILILHAMTVCHCWFMLARSLYTTLLAHHPELARTNLRYSTNSGTSDAVLASTYLAKARELGLENSLRMNLFRILMSPTVAFD